MSKYEMFVNWLVYVGEISALFISRMPGVPLSCILWMLGGIVLLKFVVNIFFKVFNEFSHED